MNLRKKWLRLSLAIAVVLVFVGVTGVQASMHIPPNGTETTFDAETGEVSFDYDMNSEYDLSYIPDVDEILQEDQISYIPQDNVIGTLYEFIIPNFYDPLPKKTVDVTLKGRNSGASGLELARVIDVFGSETPYGEPGPSFPVKGEFVDGTIAPTLVTERWEIFPNPDFDYVKVWAPVQFELESIEIVTQSVPLPPAALLLGSALFGLIFLRRKGR
jgi:hypothetical protein